ncbi:MAG: hypothetical protein WD335_03310 [Candidatus Paceibacterota bacterium]
MKNKLIITTALTIAVFLTGAFITQAQTDVRVEAQQQTEVRSEGDTDTADDEQTSEQQEANYNNSRSNRSTVRDDGDTDGDGYSDVRAADGADARSNSTTSAAIDPNDADSDDDGIIDGTSRAGKRIDKTTPKLIEALSIDENSPLQNVGVEIRVRGDVCTGDDCDDDDDTNQPPTRADVSIRVSGDDVRGWSEEQKEEVRSRLQAASEITTANDFGLRVASAALDNEDVVDIASDKETTEVRYKTRLRLFGFIPTQATATARATSNGEVTVDYPWYSFLAQKVDENIFAQLTARLRADHDVMISVEEEGVERTLRDDAE